MAGRFRPDVGRIVVMLLLATAGLGVQGCVADGPQAIYARAGDRLYLGDYRGALRLYGEVARQVFEDDAGRTLRRRAMLRAAEIHELYLRDYPAAIAGYRAVLTEEGQSAEAFTALGRIAVIYRDAYQDLRRAVVELSRLVATFPHAEGVDQYQLRLVQDYFTLREFEQARTEADIFLRRFADSKLVHEVRFMKANSFTLEQKLDAAAPILRQVIDEAADEVLRARALAELGAWHENHDQFDEAIDAYRRALGYHPNPRAIGVRLERARERRHQLNR